MSPLPASAKMVVLVMLGLGLMLGITGILSVTPSVQAAPTDHPALRPQTAGIVATCDEVSLRAALTGGGTITFACSGVITVTSSLSVTAPTTIDGSGQSVTLSGGNAVRIIDTTSGVGTLAMQNITLTNGFITGTNQAGGALRVLGNLLLTDTNVISNFASGGGGGVYVTGTLRLLNAQLISNTTISVNGGGGTYARGAVALNGGLFQNNSCTDINCNGGGLYAASTLTLTNTQFMSNTAGNSGGGASTNGSVTLNGGLFQNNLGYSGSGGGLNTYSTLTLSGTQFVRNRSLNGGGARVMGVAILNGGIFLENRADSGFGGAGGGLNTASMLTLTGTQFLSNTTASTDMGGAGVYTTGGITATDALFQFNRADHGAGLWAASSFMLTNVRFIDNVAGNTGGGIYHNYRSGRIVNSLFLRNRATNEGAALTFESSGNVQILHTTIADTILNSRAAIFVRAGTGTVGITNTIIVSHVRGIRQWTGTVYVDYNLFYNNTTSKMGVIGGGMHDRNGDPLFVDLAHDDSHIGADSAAVDAGIDAGITTDFDGDARPQDIGVDIGYDEVLQQCSLSPNTDYVFSSPAITLNFSAMGNVNCVAAVYFPRAAPHATGTIGHGVGADHFWQIAARDNLGQPATGFTASVTAPRSGFTNPLLCFYPGIIGGAGWDCTGVQSYNPSTVTRQGITHFSDWAVGNDVGPTAITLESTSAKVVSQPIDFLAAFCVVLTMGLVFLRRRSQQIG